MARHQRQKIVSQRRDGNEPVDSAHTHDYDEPFVWWGYHWTPPEPRSLVWLIERGAIETQPAAFLSLAIEGRATVLIVAEPHEAGKTTLLTALIDFLPSDTRRIYLRGWYERFAFLDSIPPETGYILCNEISAHLPTYLWGRGVRRIFEAVSSGYPLATTMHATSGSDALDQLVSYPLDVPAEHLGPIDLIVTIGVGYVSNHLLRRVVRIERVIAGDGMPRLMTLAERDPLRADLTFQVGRMIGEIARIHGCSDDDAAAAFARRVRQLEAWREAGHANFTVTCRCRAVCAWFLAPHELAEHRRSTSSPVQSRGVHASLGIYRWW
jgi:hypothetical protein